MESWSFTVGAFQFNSVDVILIVLVFISSILGALKGFAKEFSSRFGFFIAIIVAGVFNTLVSGIVYETFNLPMLWSSFSAFLIVFVIAYIVMLSLGNFLEKALEVIHLGWLDAILGLVLGAVEMTAIVCFILYLLNLQSVIDLSVYLNGSEFYNRFLLQFIDVGLTTISEAVEHV